MFNAYEYLDVVGTVSRKTKVERDYGRLLRQSQAI